MSNRNGDRWKRPEREPEPATNPGPKPGDFPVGSPESRAAARALVERKRQAAKLLILHWAFPRPPWTPETFKERYPRPPEAGPDEKIFIEVHTDELEELEEWLKRNDK